MTDKNRNTRALTMRKINQSISNVDSAMNHMDWVGNQYAADYPKQADVVSKVIIALKMCRDILDQSKGEF